MDHLFIRYTIRFYECRLYVRAVIGFFCFLSIPIGGMTVRTIFQLNAFR